MDSKFSLIDEKANPFPFVSICKIFKTGGRVKEKQEEAKIMQMRQRGRFLPKITFLGLYIYIYIYCLRLTSVKRTKIERDSLLEPTVTVALQLAAFFFQKCRKDSRPRIGKRIAISIHLLLFFHLTQLDSCQLELKASRPIIDSHYRARLLLEHLYFVSNFAPFFRPTNDQVDKGCPEINAKFEL